MNMNCPNCGAALQPVGNRSYFRCPYCETFHFPVETGDGIAVIGGETQHDCPVCSKTLTRAAIEGHAVEYCGTCRGFLASNESFALLVLLKRARSNPAPQVPIPFARDELKRRVNCPCCRKAMDTHPYHAGGNAIIDTCFRCQVVWLDAGELNVIGSYKSRSGTVITPPSLEPDQPLHDPTQVISLFGFPIRVS
jgi:Zn-finger nucleic acid-binding protein